jgi:hypothetical protein
MINDPDGLKVSPAQSFPNISARSTAAECSLALRSFAVLVAPETTVVVGSKID